MARSKRQVSAIVAYATARTLVDDYLAENQVAHAALRDRAIDVVASIATTHGLDEASKASNVEGAVLEAARDRLRKTAARLGSK